MFKLLSIAPVAALAMALPATPAAAQERVNVRFAPGASASTQRGIIRGYQYRDYLVNARAGQRMTVSMNTPNNFAYFNILPPGAAGQAQFTGSMDGRSFSGRTLAAGNTIVRVYLMRNAARRNETATYVLNIAVGAGGAAGDALVPGTGYNARGSVRCGRTAFALTGMCRASVKRFGNGTSQVDLVTPQNGSRTLFFRGTNLVRTNGGDFRVRRMGDDSLVAVAGLEFYEIPDALVVGG